jgi:hypothetical protein
MRLSHNTHGEMIRCATTTAIVMFFAQTAHAAGAVSATEASAVHSYLENSYYADADIKYSFRTIFNEQIDCIDFYAQHSVKAFQAHGLSIDLTKAPSIPAPALSTTIPDSAFTGQLDPNGHRRACPAGMVAMIRPTLAQIENAGGVDAYQNKMARRAFPSGQQSSFEHDCYLNTVPGAGGFPTSTYEHAVGILNQTAYGLVTTAAVYSGTVENEGEHQDSQLWAQTGTCEAWYGSDLCTTGVNGNAVQSVEVGWINEGAATNQNEQLFVFITQDGYNTGCFANNGIGCCPGATSNGLTQGVDCWVHWPNAQYTPDTTIFSSVPTGTAPSEVTLQVWQGSASGSPGWWVWVNGNLIGWYPPNSFTWPGTNISGPMATGPATYLQVGGEVFDTWPNNQHTATSMGSGFLPSAGYGWAAYQRNVEWYDSSNSLHSSPLGFYVAPSYEGDHNVPGLCGFDSGGWTNSVTPGYGSYGLSTTGAPSGANWGSYFFFGGGNAGPG